MKQLAQIIVILFYINIQLDAQSLLPTIGKPLPDFTLEDMTHYKNKHFSNQDLKGQWTFIDFWSSTCTSCITSFPKISKLQEQFKKQALFLLIGINDQTYNKNIKQLFEKLVKKQNLHIASAYDSILSNHWEIGSLPHIIIVDPDGIVRHITGGRDMTAAKIQDLIDGKPVSFYPKSFVQNKPLEKANPAQQVNEPTEILFNSIITRWKNEKQSVPLSIDDFINFNKTAAFQVTMVPLEALYKFAYTGMWDWTSNDSLYTQIHPNIILELDDSVNFLYDYTTNVGMGTYNYSLTVPKEQRNKNTVMKVMQQDLKSTFGYEVLVENKEMPVWLLVAKKEAVEKLKTKGGDRYYNGGISGGPAGFTVTNYPISSFLDLVKKYISKQDPSPFLNATGIEGNIDVTIDALMTNRADIRKALQKKGMDLIKKNQTMKVIVIKKQKDNL